jgi:hypothetical protein
MQLKRQPNVALPTYSVTFPEPLPAGDYEFGETEGTLAFFFRCGFTVKK